MLKLFRSKPDIGRQFVIDTNTAEAIEVEEVISFEAASLPEIKAITCEVDRKRKTVKVKRIITEQKIKTKVKSENNGKRWSRDFDACIICGRTDSPHAAKGKCKNCYNKKFNEDKRGDKPKRKWGRKFRENINKDNAPSSSAVNKYECKDCDHRFMSVLDIDEAKCPVCFSTKIKLAQ